MGLGHLPLEPGPDPCGTGHPPAPAHRAHTKCNEMQVSPFPKITLLLHRLRGNLETKKIPYRTDCEARGMVVRARLFYGTQQFSKKEKKRFRPTTLSMTEIRGVY